MTKVYLEERNRWLLEYVLKHECINDGNPNLPRLLTFTLLPPCRLSSRDLSYSILITYHTTFAKMSLAFAAEKQVAIAAVRRACVLTSSVFNQLVKNETLTKDDKSPVTGGWSKMLFSKRCPSQASCFYFLLSGLDDHNHTRSDALPHLVD